MRQAIHIFLKDVRRLRLQIAILMAAIACFAVLDVRPPSNALIAMELVVATMVWFLIGTAVHEECLADDDEFWLTRPYERGSLFGARMLTAALVVCLPLLVADCVILAMKSLPFTTYLPTLVLRQIFISLWLILPPLAIASVTRTLAQNVMAWIAAAAIGALTWFPGTLRPSNDFRAVNEKYALAIALVLAVVVLWRQFAHRGTHHGTTVSRVVVAIAILLPAPPFPESAALAIERLQNSEPERTSHISVAAAVQSVTEPVSAGYLGKHRCVAVPLAVDGLPSGWEVVLLSQRDTFNSGAKTWSNGWHQGSGITHFGNAWVCADSDDLAGVASLSVRSSIALAVYEPEKPIRVPATLSPFDVPGVGRCVFVPNTQHEYDLTCGAAVWAPPSGEIVVVGHDTLSAEIAPAEFPWTPFGLLPGFSPVDSWSTMALPEGDPGAPMGHPKRMARFGLQILIHDGGEIEFRPRRLVTVLRREIAVREVRFQSARR